MLPAATWAAGLFGMMEIKSDRVSSIPKWVDVLGRIDGENLLGKCRAGNCSGKQAAWYAMVQDLQGSGRQEQMVRVNRWLNRYPYINDDKLWGVTDFWETPGVFVVKSGDCEDYAIAKYYTLKALGWDESDLRLVVLHDAVRDLPHAVLAVKYNGANYILDNLATEPLQDKYIRQYTPYYAVNADTRWVFIKPMGQ
jgi:predicted transglutaminase-like cysteine proteinase